ncbi:type I restriction enzyme HsdR N-terminal domain-containing protein [Tranquillimonas alkanivorans]|nr:type I restriction enzyme HsdR N-terminal domain-containing protein [Tranquillimonas alkanivorans]
MAADKPQAAPERVTLYEVKGEEYMYCPIRKRTYKVTNKPEEKVRQWWLYQLRDHYGYSFDRIGVEVPVKVGSSEAKKKADIVVYTDKTKRFPRIFVEVKKQNRTDGLDQLEVYMNATGCRLGLWSNGGPSNVYLLRIEPAEGQEEASWRELRNIPSANEKLEDVDSPITRAHLAPVEDFLSILRECEDHIKAHEGVNVFDEIL